MLDPLPPYARRIWYDRLGFFTMILANARHQILSIKYNTYCTLWSGAFREHLSVGLDLDNVLLPLGAQLLHQVPVVGR